MPDLKASDSPCRCNSLVGYLLLVVFGTIVGGLAFWRYQTLQTQAQAEEQIRAVLAEQVAAWNRGDLEGFMAGYWKSNEMTFCSGNDVTKGWQPTFDRYRKLYQAEGKEMGQTAFEDVQVEVVTTDVAIVRGRWKLSLRNDNPVGLFTLQLKRLPEGWRVVYDHTSSAEKKPPVE